MTATQATLRHTDDLLLDREIAALRLVILFRLVFALSTLFSTLAIGKSADEKTITTVLTLLAAGSTLPFWLALNRRRWVKSIGLAGVLFDVVFYILLPYIWYFSVGGPETVSPAFMLKHPNLITMSYILLLAHSLAGRPRYPLTMATGATIGAVSIFVFAHDDPRLQFSADFVNHILGESVSLEFWLTGTISYALVGGLLSWHVHQTNRGIRKAVRQETDNLLLSRYFSPAIQREILSQNRRAGSANDQGSPFDGAGARKNIAVMFCDLRGFTTAAEKLSPEEATAWLREYHEAMVNTIFEFGGTLDKFLGDGILATFGTPELTPAPAARAVQAALAMRTAMGRLNESRSRRGLPALRQGIGIHYGPAIVGNVGVPERLEYTVIGDTVNLASRIEGLCKQFGVDLLISSAVAARLLPGAEPGSSAATTLRLHDRFESLGLQEIRGRAEGVELLRARDERPLPNSG